MDDPDSPPAERSRTSATPTLDWFIRFLAFDVLIAPWLIRILYVVFSLIAALWLLELNRLRAVGWGSGRPYTQVLGGPFGELLWFLCLLALIRVIAEALFVIVTGRRSSDARQRAQEAPAREVAPAAGKTRAPRASLAALPQPLRGYLVAMAFSAVALFFEGYVHERTAHIPHSMVDEPTGLLMLLVSVAAVILALRWPREPREPWLLGALRGAVAINVFLALIFGATAGESGFDIDLRGAWYLFAALQVLAWLSLLAVPRERGEDPREEG